MAVTQLIPNASGTGVVAVDGGVAAVISERVVPFHWFPKMEPVPAVTEVPSTSHTLLATHETEVRRDEVAPAGVATVASVHTVPFHVSAIGPEPDLPTARQNDGPTQETESSSSPVVADGKIYVTNEEGLTTVFKAGPKFEILAENNMDEYCLSTIAISEGQLFLRTDKALYAIGQRKAGAGGASVDR